ncbi:MAG: 1-deoxy-D-xylulose-5-phosphate synthase [Peptostreptococcaceae bacterium]|nr:1-deoxy-D-xylulose-5-phosphate synthase [Peptostreptococcaceae bacterium]
MSINLKDNNLLEKLQQMDVHDMELLSDEIRSFLIESVSKTGGHLASNLGVVELTIAMHKMYNSPTDKFIFDVGHQSYVHKILTGRAAEFDSLRKYKGLSGFPKGKESVHDAYETGHSTTSLSAAMGMATARDLDGDDYEVIAVIGDGSMTGGMAYEALNNIGTCNKNIKIILNDNGMSISKNIGSLSLHLSKLRASKDYLSAKDNVKTFLDNVPVVGKGIKSTISVQKDLLKYSLYSQGVFIEEMGVEYIGPIDGHNIEKLMEAMEIANKVKGPTLIHVITKKGKGYYWAEKYPKRFHGISAFDTETGKPLSKTIDSYSEVFGKKLLKLAEENKDIVAITAAMGAATGLTYMHERFPERTFDVGLAEQHGVTFAAGLAKAGKLPVVAIYSTFLQRSFDQIIEDVALQNLHVIFAVDRAGLVGADGETHHGQYDISYLSMIPNMTILSPCDGKQLEEMLDYAVKLDGPVAIRYPRGTSVSNHLRLRKFNGNNITLKEGKDLTIFAVGSMLDIAIEASDKLGKQGYDTGVVNVCSIKPVLVPSIDSKLYITIEDGSLSGGFGERFNMITEIPTITLGIPDRFIEHGSVDELREELGLTSDSIVKGARDYFEKRETGCTSCK